MGRLTHSPPPTLHFQHDGAAAEVCLVFTSSVFLYAFLPVVLAGYYLLHPRYRNAFLAGSSYVFYMWALPKFAILMFISTLIDYGCVRLMHTKPAARKAALLTAIGANLGLLAWFKYANFFVDNLNTALSALSMGGVELAPVILPVGISFYTFQSMSYSVDVYRGRAEPCTGFLDFMCYVALFPQLVAGPIVRYVDIAADLKHRKSSLDRFSVGSWLFMIGLVKKVMIANQIGGMADAAFTHNAPGLIDAWVGLSAYTLQIYFDFSGYSDMALGLGAMFAFTFPINFNSPYQARSISDFWRRWHITLSTWFREFVYIPLGGNRISGGRTLFNLVATFFLSGLWHGAQWTFVLWGLYHGLFLLLERAFRHKDGGLFGFLPGPARIAPTLLIVMLGWVLFRAPDLAAAGRYYLGLFGIQGVGDLTLLTRWSTMQPLYVLGAAALLALFAPNSNRLALKLNPPLVLGVFVLFVYALFELSEQRYNPFLYFQF